MKIRASFILHLNSLDVLDSLTDEQNGKLFKKIKLYNQGEEYLSDDKIVEIVFVQFKNQFDRDIEKYNNICKRNKDNNNKSKNKKEINIIDNKEFLEKINKKQIIDKYSINETELNNELELFINYWTEQNPKGKQKWQFEKTFEPNRRFARWLSNNKKWSKSNNSEEQERQKKLADLEIKKKALFNKF